MNKIFKRISIILFIISVPGTSSSAPKPPYYSPSNNWKGFHAGLNVEIDLNHIEIKSNHLGFTDPSETCNGCANFSSFVSGIQLGYMHQIFNHLRLGIEANVTFNINQENILNCFSSYNPNVYDGFSFSKKLQNFIKLRMGPVLNKYENILLYLTTGPTLANIELTYNNEGGDHYSEDDAQAGWLIGVGLEWNFMNHWSLRAEYGHIIYGQSIKLKLPSVYNLIDPNGNAQLNLNSNNVILAINYWL